MAAAARNLRNRNARSVEGSLAHDLDWAVRERELLHAGEAPPKQKQAAKIRSAVRVRLRERQYVSKFAVLGAAAIGVLAVLILMSYVQLTMLSSQMVDLQGQLQELETDNVVLTAQYEQMFDMATVKEAAEAAGMRKPSSGQLFHLDMSGGDRAVAYDKEQPNLLRRLFAALNHGVYAVVEYFD